MHNAIQHWPILIGFALFAAFGVGGAAAESLSSKPCTPPASGDWIVTESCSINGTVALPGNLRVLSGVELTITGGSSLDVDFSTHKAVVDSGGRLTIQQGGELR